MTHPSLFSLLATLGVVLQKEKAKVRRLNRTSHQSGVFERLRGFFSQEIFTHPTNSDTAPAQCHNLLITLVSLDFCGLNCEAAEECVGSSSLRSLGGKKSKGDSAYF